MKHLATIRAATLGAACALSACRTNDSGVVGPSDEPDELVAEAPLAAAKGAVPPDQRALQGASPAIPQEPLECQDTIKEAPCMKYRIPLLGNPSSDPVLRAKYKAAFGSACYTSAANAFNCFYKREQMTAKGKACADAWTIPKVFGAAEYDKGYECKKVGNGTEDWWLQVGPDVSNKIDIMLENAPLESDLIDVGNGVQVTINGPYRNLPEPSKVEPGREFDCASGQFGADGKSLSQIKYILDVNRKAHKNAQGEHEIHSDLAGFMHPCTVGSSTLCTEPMVLEDPAKPRKDIKDPMLIAQVHHEVRKTDKRGCKWGTNSNKNAAVISRRLNQHLYNKYPDAKEVDLINMRPPYTP